MTQHKVIKMAKRRSKKITDFLLQRIERTENSILENHGAVPFDFEKLVRYHKVLECYDYDEPEEIAEIENKEPPKKKGKKPKTPIPPVDEPEEPEEEEIEEETE